ncbi:MAG: phage capsid protein [Lachnospiraceae bacterium]
MFPVDTLKNIIGEQIALSSEMIRKIELWSASYSGNAPWCQDDIHSLGIEHGIVREFANTTLNEMETSLSDGKLDEYYQAGLRDLNENLQAGLALGAFIIKPLGTDGGVQYITQESFIPLEYDSRGRLTRVVMMDVRRIHATKFYVRFEFHLRERGVLIIRNKVYQSADMVTAGSPVPLDIVEEWAKLPEEIIYPIDYVDFGYYRNPVNNTIDKSKCGVSIYDGALPIIQKADIQFGRLDWEYESGERAVHADVTTIQQAGGKFMMDKRNKRLYRGLDVGNEEILKEYSPDMRDEAYIRGLEEYKRDIEFVVGLAYGDLSKVSEVEKTAEEIKSSKQRKHNAIVAIQANLKDCLEDFVRALAFYQGMATRNIKLACDFKDSVLTDEEKERQSDREDVAIGAMELWEYIVKHRGKTEAEAKKIAKYSEPDIIE